MGYSASHVNPKYTFMYLQVFGNIVMFHKMPRVDIFSFSWLAVHTERYS